jgi:hypothetical protein
MEEKAAQAFHDEQQALGRGAAMFKQGLGYGGSGPQGYVINGASSRARHQVKACMTHSSTLQNLSLF